MNNSSKTIVTILLIAVFLVISIFLLSIGASKTFVGLFAIGIFLGIRAMWKKSKNELSGEIKLDKKSDKPDDIMLQK